MGRAVVGCRGDEEFQARVNASSPVPRWEPKPVAAAIRPHTGLQPRRSEPVSCSPRTAGCPCRRVRVGTPESLMPPNGDSASDQEMLLMNIMPVSTRLAARLPRARSLVKTEPPNPKSKSLASAIAASSSLTLAEEHRDRAKELVPERRILRLHVRQDRGLHVETIQRDELACLPLAPSRRGNRGVDLLEKMDQRPILTTTTSVVFSSSGSPGFRAESAVFELLQEFVREFVDNDKSLRRAAGLPGIVHQTAH